ncbi:Mrp/NBP35 family ATP-binding protein [Thalassospira sp. GO-4]|jgi:ATP-binding protein involved in chromosome partitioning|uniref:Mrp/NBP35 family ATP-binding protein n=1 Tax=Thalassospira TaxID=168934 RepID=UPI002023ED77|nr:Mrp/NBP35 family ATP-binding protein [Thalassospira sp. GO-4]URK17754.1 Mrp/NBP35 family ATP-binding protein [Thalassospira sp. GO-4]
MTSLNREQIVAALDSVIDPVDGKSITAKDMVQGIDINNEVVNVMIAVDPKRGPALEDLRQAAEKAVAAVNGVTTARVALTAERPAAASQSAPQQPAAARPAQPGQRPQGAGQKPLELPTVRSIVTVASGKGGVGKSTTSVNLALSLVAKGLKVGLLDADIYGPSLPRMMGLRAAKPTPSSEHQGKMIPPSAFGIRIMSIGFMVDEEQPVIWRGPMAMGALEQLLRDTDWGDIDVLVVDMPPGTGDIQLSMAQRVPVTGAVIVSTPQDIALLDAKKGLNMFRKVNVPVFGLIENMSYYKCPECGHVDHVFDHGGARKAADELGVPFLGEIPLDLKIRLGADEGKPIVQTEADGEHAKAYGAIAQKIATAIEERVGPTEAPKKKGLFPKISFK